LLLLQPTEVAVGYDGVGDFSIGAAGRMRRRAEGDSASLVFMGVQLLHPRLFEGCIVARYSLNRLYDQALAAGRLFGLVHDGDWFHVGTPEDLAVTERLMSAGGSGE
jgi:MurNAc alpha-1-phosphate uridylyltransferase